MPLQNGLEPINQVTRRSQGKHSANRQRLGEVTARRAQRQRHAQQLADVQVSQQFEGAPKQAGIADFLAVGAKMFSDVLDMKRHEEELSEEEKRKSLIRDATTQKGWNDNYLKDVETGLQGLTAKDKDDWSKWLEVSDGVLNKYINPEDGGEALEDGDFIQQLRLDKKRDLRSQFEAHLQHKRIAADTQRVVNVIAEAAKKDDGADLNAIGNKLVETEALVTSKKRVADALVNLQAANPDNEAYYEAVQANTELAPDVKDKVKRAWFRRLDTTFFSTLEGYTQSGDTQSFDAWAAKEEKRGRLTAQQVVTLHGKVEKRRLYLEDVDDLRASLADGTSLDNAKASNPLVKPDDVQKVFSAEFASRQQAEVEAEKRLFQNPNDRQAQARLKQAKEHTNKLLRESGLTVELKRQLSVLTRAIGSDQELTEETKSSLKLAERMLDAFGGAGAMAVYLDNPALASKLATFDVLRADGREQAWKTIMKGSESGLPVYHYSAEEINKEIDDKFGSARYPEERVYMQQSIIKMGALGVPMDKALTQLNNELEGTPRLNGRRLYKGGQYVAQLNALAAPVNHDADDYVEAFTELKLFRQEMEVQGVDSGDLRWRVNPRSPDSLEFYNMRTGRTLMAPVKAKTLFDKVNAMKGGDWGKSTASGSFFNFKKLERFLTLDVDSKALHKG